MTRLLPNKSPEPTAVGACRSAIAVHVASRRWLSFCRWGNENMKIIVTIIATAIAVGTAVWFCMIKMHHAEMNSRVGLPYVALVNQLNYLAKQGKTNELNRLINDMNENSSSIFDAWLGENDNFRQFVRKETPASPNKMSEDTARKFADPQH